MRKISSGRGVPLGFSVLFCLRSLSLQNKLGSKDVTTKKGTFMEIVLIKRIILNSERLQEDE